MKYKSLLSLSLLLVSSVVMAANHSTDFYTLHSKSLLNTQASSGAQVCPAYLSTCMIIKNNAKNVKLNFDFHNSVIHGTLLPGQVNGLVVVDLTHNSWSVTVTNDTTHKAIFGPGISPGDGKITNNIGLLCSDSNCAPWK